jgi:chaperonin GroEL (HSP60 family)
LIECSLENIDLAEETFLWLQRCQSPYPFVTVIVSGVCTPLSHTRNHAVKEALFEEAEYLETAQYALKERKDAIEEEKTLFVLGGGAIHVALATALKSHVSVIQNTSSQLSHVLQHWTQALLQVPLALAKQWALSPLPTLHLLQSVHERGERTWGIFGGRCIDLKSLTSPLDIEMWIPLSHFLRVLNRLTEWLIMYHQIEDIIFSS